jgi:hypothetical protein
MQAYTLTNDDALHILRKLAFCTTALERDAEQLTEALADHDELAPLSEENGERLMNLVREAYDA